MSLVGSKIAEPYAEALIELATSNDSLKETTNDMNIVSQFLANSSDLKKIDFKIPSLHFTSFSFTPRLWSIFKFIK